MGAASRKREDRLGPGDGRPTHHVDISPGRLGIQGPWSHGCVESLAYARTVAASSSDAGRRIAFVLIDNAVEVALKTYLSFPRSRRGGSSLQLRRDATFPELLLAMGEMFESESIPGVDFDALRHSHALRNVLYHEGNGINPDEVQVDSYMGTAEALIGALFGVQPAEEDPVARVPDTTAAPPLSQWLREAAAGIERRRQQWPEAPNELLCGGSTLEVVPEAVSEVQKLLIEQAGPDAIDWAVQRAERWESDDAFMSPDVSADYMIDFLNELADELDALNS